MATNCSTPSTTPKSGTTLRFEDPPATVRNGTAASTYQDEAAQLRERPGEWAIVAEFDGKQARSAAYRVKASIVKATYAAFTPAGSFQAVTKSVDGVTRVYARFAVKAAS